MINPLAMAMGEIRPNPFFADMAAIAGSVAGLAAFYLAATGIWSRCQERAPTAVTTVKRPPNRHAAKLTGRG